MKEFDPRDIPQKYIDDVLADGYGECEIGYKRIENNIMMVCHYAFWPHCKAEMFRWWLYEGMGRPGMYAFWHPAHSAFDWAEKTENTQLEYHREWFGGWEAEGYHNFVPPETFFDLSNAGKEVTMVIAADSEDMDRKRQGVAIHVLRDTFFGCEMRYRAFNYYDPADPEKGNISRELLQHGIYEFNETGEWLPGYYLREHQPKLRKGYPPEKESVIDA